MAENELYDAVKSGNADRVTNLLDRPGMKKQVTKMYDDNSETLLTIAARCKNPKIVKILHEAGADLDKRNFSGKAPLHVSSFEGDLKVTKALLDCGADINIPDDSGKMALHWAVNKNKHDIIRTLVEHGANVDAKTSHGVTILHEAVKNSSDATVAAIIEKNANIHAVNADNDNVLHAAIKQGRASVVDVLIKLKGVPVDEVTSKGETILHLSAIATKQNIAEYLIQDQKVNTDFINKQMTAGDTSLKGNTVDTNGWTALHIVTAVGLVKFVQYLLDNGADKNIKNAKGQTAADVAKAFKQNKLLGVLEPPVRVGGKKPGASKYGQSGQYKKTEEKDAGSWLL